MRDYGGIGVNVHTMNITTSLHFYDEGW